MSEMKINENVLQTKTMLFKQVPIRSTFIVDQKLYGKIKDFHLNGFGYNCIHLPSFSFFCLGSNVTVELCDVELVACPVGDDEICMRFKNIAVGGTFIHANYTYMKREFFNCDGNSCNATNLDTDLNAFFLPHDVVDLY